MSEPPESSYTEEIEPHSDKAEEQKSHGKVPSACAPQTFKCGCGKLYLSQSTLSTHVRSSHSGVNPKRTQTSLRRSRGRPRKFAANMVYLRPQIPSVIDSCKTFTDEIQYLVNEGAYEDAGVDPCVHCPDINLADGTQLQSPLKRLLTELASSHALARSGYTVKPIELAVQWTFAKFLYDYSRASSAEFYTWMASVFSLLFQFLETEVQPGFCGTDLIDDLSSYFADFLSYLRSTHVRYDKDKVRRLLNHFSAWLYFHEFTSQPFSLEDAEQSDCQ